jgi:hypothetical protein
MASNNGVGSPGYLAPQTVPISRSQLNISHGVRLFFRVSAARYRLNLAFTDPPTALVTLLKRIAPSSWRLPASALAGPNTEPNTSISLELTLSLKVISLRAISLPRWPEDLRLRTQTRRSSFSRNSPHELFAPFSTSSRAGLPARVSTPASFRLHRWSGLDGLLPARPCRLLSSGGTLGVARTVTKTSSLLS